MASVVVVDVVVVVVVLVVVVDVVVGLDVEFVISFSAMTVVGVSMVVVMVDWITGRAVERRAGSGGPVAFS